MWFSLWGSYKETKYFDYPCALKLNDETLPKKSVQINLSFQESVNFKKWQSNLIVQIYYLNLRGFLYEQKKLVVMQVMTSPVISTLFSPSI